MIRNNSVFSTKTSTVISDTSRSMFPSEKICRAALLSSSFAIFCLCVCPQESEGGLYVCMNTFLGFGREHVERHYRKTGQSVYMHLKRHVKEVCPTPSQGFRLFSLALFTAAPHLQSA